MEQSSAQNDGGFLEVYRGKDEFTFLEKYLDVKRVKTHYVTIGTGEKTLLIIPGFPAPWSAYWEIAAIFSKKYKVVVLDLPGFIGRSDELNTRYTLSNFTRFVYAFMQEADVEPNYILGISYGGSIALNLLIDHPELTEKLILHAPAYGVPLLDIKLKLLLKLLTFIYQRGPADQLITPLIRKYILTDGTRTITEHYKLQQLNGLTKQFLLEEVKHVEIDSLIAIAQDIIKPMKNSELKQVTKETLIITGSKDDLIDPADSKELATSVLPHAKFIEFPGENHWLSVTQPERFCEVVLKFLA